MLKDFRQHEGERYGIRRMGIFGSVARGEQSPESDVDVYFEGDAPGFFTLSHLKNELEELLGCRVDLVRLRDRMNSILRKHIEKEGIYV